MRTIGLEIEEVEKKTPKEQLIHRLTELGIEFDKNCKVEELKALLPEE